jgi:hypothetical protein
MTSGRGWWFGSREGDVVSEDVSLSLGDPFLSILSYINVRA